MGYQVMARPSDIYICSGGMKVFVVYCSNIFTEVISYKRMRPMNRIFVISFPSGPLWNW